MVAAENAKIRRDTHDDSVPNTVFDLLERTMPLCPNLKFVVLEQLGTGLETEESRRLFQEDFFKLDHIVEKQNAHSFANATNTFFPSPFSLPKQPIEDPVLAKQQLQLSKILERATDYDDAQARLAASDLAHSDWKIEKWAPYMLETAMQIAQKWQSRN
jgi:uncharacterized protein